MSTKIISLDEFAYLILNLYQNIPADQRAPIKRVIGWIRTAHKMIVESEYDISVVKLAVRQLEDLNDKEKNQYFLLGGFCALCDHYELNIIGSFLRHIKTSFVDI